MKKVKSQNADIQQSVKEQKIKEQPSFQVQFDITYGGTYVTKSGESLTVPDMNLTVRQLLNNHSRGLTNDKYIKEPIYFDFKIPKIKDIVDVIEYQDYLKEHTKQVEDFIKKAEEEEEQNAKAKEKEKYRQMKLDDELEQKQQNAENQ